MVAGYTLTKEMETLDITYTDGNLRWVQFISDHIQVIISNSKKVLVDVNALNKYRYRPRDLFFNYGITAEDTWIIMMINNLKLSEAIPQYTNKFFIPHQDYLNELKEYFSAYDSEHTA
jgi:hypothetical protein